MKNPKYTFLLPAYKGRFLDEMLRSIQTQTYKNFKVIISDDCSPEDLYSICKPYLADSRFSFRRNEKNMGSDDLVAHWNLLVNMCDTEYLILASDDDVYDSRFLEEMEKLVNRYTSVDVFRGRMMRIDECGLCYDKDALFEEKVDTLQFVFDMYCNHYLQGIANFVFRTKQLQDDDGFINFPLAWFSDNATVIRSSKNGLVNTTSFVFSFRESSIQISYISENGNSKKIEAACSFFDWFKKEMLLLPHEDSRFLEYRKTIVLKENEQYIKRQIVDNLGATTIFEMLSLYKWLKRNLLLYRKYEVYYFFKLWIRSKVHHRV